jgi:hypothetical protein
MRASEMIAHLQAIIETDGDLPLRMPSGPVYEDRDVDKPEAQPADFDTPYPHIWISEA